MMNLDAKYKSIISTLLLEAPFEPDMAIILGSGLGNFANSINTVKSVYTSDLPGYPAATVPGHKGIIHFAEYESRKVLLFQGRIHLYEGYPISDCILPVFLAKKLGCKTLLLTNAAGGINTKLIPGSLMLATSFISIFVKKELTKLVGLATLDAKNRILDFPSSKVSSIIKRSALDENILLQEGIYFYVKGPSYETPAEIEMIKRSGGDAVGMSSAHEAFFSSYLGMNTAAISCITNYASGISPVKLAHEDVTETADKTKYIFERLMKRVIQNITF